MVDDPRSRADLPPPPYPLAKSTFTGGIRAFGFHFGGTWPFGHLEFDEHEIEIFGLGMRAEGRRDRGHRVRVGMGRSTSRVTIIDARDAESDCYFIPVSRAVVIDELRRRGWTVIEDRALGRYDPERVRPPKRRASDRGQPDDQTPPVADPRD